MYVRMYRGCSSLKNALVLKTVSSVWSICDSLVSSLPLQVTGDNVASLAFVDFNLDGNMELVVGSEDYDLRVFRGDELLGEISEVDVSVV